MKYEKCVLCLHDATFVSPDNLCKTCWEKWFNYQLTELESSQIRGDQTTGDTEKPTGARQGN